MEHILLTDSTRIVCNSWKIPEPSEGIVFDPKLLEVVFVPLLICDLKGQRVGYGQGYYDRFLSQCKPEVIKIGLSLFDPIEAITDIYEEILLWITAFVQKRYTAFSFLFCEDSFVEHD